MKKKHLIDLRNSLRRRGFWVDILEGKLVLDSWFTRSNYYEMFSLLSSLEISVEGGDRGIRIKSNSSILDDILVGIETAKRNNISRHSGEVQLPISFQPSSRNDLTILELDYGVTSLVYSLNKVGLYTSMSCDGYGREDAKIWFNGNQINEVRHHFDIASREIIFVYDWEVKKKRVGFVLMGKKRLSSESWDVSKVQDDALAFSKFILDNNSTSAN